MSGVMRWIIAVLFASLPLIGDQALAQTASADRAVSVTGSGPTIDESKTDAIRQALQQTLKQLLVVDRAISGDRILRDKVMSTMNGYIESYKQKAVRKDTNGFSIDAEITV